MDKIKSLSSTNKMSDISSLIGSIRKIGLEEPQLSSRCKKGKRVGKQSTLASDSSRQKMTIVYNSNTSQDLEYNKTSAVLKKNKSNWSQKFEKITSSDKQLKKDSSTYSRASNACKKYYSTINSNSDRDHKASTQRLRKDIEELKTKHKKNFQNHKHSQKALSNYKPERNSKVGKNYEGPARIQAQLVLSDDKNGNSSKILKVTSSRSITETEAADHSTIAQSTSYTSGYFKRAIKSNKKLENLTNKYGDYKRPIKQDNKINFMMKGYNKKSKHKNDLSKG